MKKNHLLGFVWIAVAILLSVILALELTAKGSTHNLGKWFSKSFTGDNSIETGVPFLHSRICLLPTALSM